MKYKM